MPPLGGFSWDFILGKFTKICLGSPYLVDFWHDGLSSCYIVDSVIFNTTIHKALSCASMVRLLTFITLLTATYVRQYLLPLHGNTGYTTASHYHVVPYIAYLVFRDTVQLNMYLTALIMNGTLIFSNVLSFNTWSTNNFYKKAKVIKLMWLVYFYGVLTDLYRLWMNTGGLWIVKGSCGNSRVSSRVQYSTVQLVFSHTETTATSVSITGEFGRPNRRLEDNRTCII